MSFVSDLFEAKFKIVAGVTALSAFLVANSTIDSYVMSFLGYNDVKISISDPTTYLADMRADVFHLKKQAGRVQFILHKPYEAELRQCFVYYRLDKEDKFTQHDAYYETVPKYKSDVMWTFNFSMDHGTKLTVEFYAKCKEGMSNLLKADVAG
jgi:hypothetical protein